MLTFRIDEKYIPKFVKLENELSFLSKLEADERSELKKIIANWQAEVAKHALSSFQAWHLTRVPTFTGASYRSLRHFSGRSSQSYSGRWDAVGYYPMGSEKVDTPITRSVEVYWGGRDVQGVLSRLGGLAPGVIKFPRKGAGGPGTFGGFGYSRVGYWAEMRGLTPPPKRVRRGGRGLPPSEEDSLRRLVLALVRHWELRGMKAKGNPARAFPQLISSVIRGRWQILVSQIRNWWDSLERKA